MAHRRINVILMDMSHEYTTSGVDRYMDVLACCTTRGLSGLVALG